MKRVIILSPYRGDIGGNLVYARRCMADSVRRFEAPFASHLLYPFILNDTDPSQRTKGFELEAAWLVVADLVAVYIDLKVSSGMKKTLATIEEICTQRERLMPIEYRSLNGPVTAEQLKALGL